MHYLKHNALTTWDWKEEIGPDDRMSLPTLTGMCKAHLLSVDLSRIRELINQSQNAATQKTAWRIDGILREFPKFDPVNVWFDYPVHQVDEDGLLADVNPEEEKTPYQRMLEAKKKQSEKDNAEKISQFAIAFEGLVDDSGCVRLADIAEEIGVSKKTIGAWLGTGYKSKKELKKEFTKFMNDDDPQKITYIKRKE